MSYFETFAAAQSYLQNADHFDEKVIEGEVDLRTFIANTFHYHPAWLQFLYHVRGVFVRFLGMKQAGIPQASLPDPQAVSFVPNSRYSFFTVEQAEENHYWFASASDKHLRAYLLIAVEPLGEKNNRFYVGTVVHYQHWTGILYFNVIRPFHHLVVQQMMQAGVKD